MSKSSIRKTRTKSVVTNISISWFDATGIASNVAETGDLIYVIPRQGEAVLKSMLWTVQLEQDPSDVTIVFTLINHGRNETLLLTNELALVQRSIAVQQLAFRSITAVGVLRTSVTKEVNLRDMVLSRRSNLQSDDEFSIVAAYISTVTVNVSSSGTLFLEETKFQMILRDDLDEWQGYTFEESAS